MMLRPIYLLHDTLYKQVCVQIVSKLSSKVDSIKSVRAQVYLAKDICYRQYHNPDGE